MKEYGSRRGREKAKKYYPDTIRGLVQYELLFDIGVRDLGTTLDAARGDVMSGVNPTIRSAFAEYAASELARMVPVPDEPNNSGDPKVVWTRLMYNELERRGLGKTQPTPRLKFFRLPRRHNRAI